MAGDKNQLSIDAAGISEILGISPSELPDLCAQRLTEIDTRYTVLGPTDRDEHILKVLKRLDEPRAEVRTSAANISAFEQGWSENLELCRTKGLTRENLRPKYVRPYDCIRFRSNYIAPQNPFLAYDLLGLVTTFGFLRYFGECDSISEFGCGTAQYLFELARIYPQKTLIGTDWTSASVGIIELMAKQGLNISGRRFDMLVPDNTFRLGSNAGVLSVGALEQLGPNFQSFLQYLLDQKPAIVVHFEPIEDFYEKENLVDYLGWRYHQRRGYLQGYLPALRSLEESGKIEILAARRMPFGDPFHESGSLVVWRPIRPKA